MKLLRQYLTIHVENFLYVTYLEGLIKALRDKKSNLHEKCGSFSMYCTCFN